MKTLSNRPPRPRRRTARPVYPRALTIGAVALAAACAGTTLGCNLIGTSSGDMVGPYEQGGGGIGGAGGAHEGGGGAGGELGGGGSGGGLGGSDVGGSDVGGSDVGGSDVGGAGGGQG